MIKEYILFTFVKHSRTEICFIKKHEIFLINL